LRLELSKLLWCQFLVSPAFKGRPHCGLCLL
jgi:hypothetical protein